MFKTSNKNSHKRNHPGESCTFSNKFVPNEHYISPGGIRFPLPPSGEKLPTLLDTDGHFIALKRSSLRQKRQDYSAVSAHVQSSSKIVEDFERQLFYLMNSCFIWFCIQLYIEMN